MKKIRIVAFLSAVVVFMLSYLYLQGQKKEKAFDKITEDKQQIAVAKVAIKPNEMITAEMVELKAIPVLKDDQDYFTSMDEVVGRITITDIFAGEKITKLRTADKDSTLDLTYKIAEGKRAMAVAVNKESGVGHNIKVGDYVDVISSGKIEAGKINDIPTPAGMFFDAGLGLEAPRNTSVLKTNIDEGYATLAIQNVKVLALDSVTYFEVKKDGETREYQTVTLELSPEQARHIVLMGIDDGEVFLALRAHGDEEITDTPRDELFKTESILHEGNEAPGSAGVENSQSPEQSPNAGASGGASQRGGSSEPNQSGTENEREDSGEQPAIR